MEETLELSLNPLYVGSRLLPDGGAAIDDVLSLNPLYVGSRLLPERGYSHNELRKS